MKLIETSTTQVDGFIMGKWPVRPVGMLTKAINSILPGQRLDRPIEGHHYRVDRGLHSGIGNGIPDILGTITVTDPSIDFAINDPVIVLREERTLLGVVPWTRTIVDLKAQSPELS